MEEVEGFDVFVSGEKKKPKIKPGSFQGLGIGHASYKAIMRMGYKMPTPIQRKTIPTILDGQDVVAMARTGSGKTAAFLIPVVERLLQHSVSVGFRAVALSPTRELAMQTAKFFRQLSKFTDLRCCLLVGGQAMEAQFEHLANNPDVVIATPGRLMHHILEAELSLSRVEILIIDEADRLFELGFAEQLQKILEATPLSRQVMLFSATLPSQLVSFSRVGLKDPVFVRLDVETTLSESLDLWYLYVRKDEKIAAACSVLRFLAKPDKATIMFVATRHHVEFFGELLTQLGMSVSVVYGSMDQEARTDQIHKFRKKKTQILVTTDVAARGIDVPLLDYVLNYDFPPSGKLFVHRAGRTARAGRSGLAISLVTMDDLPYTVELMLFLGRKLAVTDGTQTAEVCVAGGIAGMPLLGALPALDHDIETLALLLHDEGSELQAFHKSMLASYHLYNKTRPAASRQSVARAKQLIEDCGGPAQLQRLIHPAFQSLASSSVGTDSLKKGGEVATAAQEADLISSLRGFRPKPEKIGNALSLDAMRMMSLAKLDAKAVSTALKSAAGDKDSSEILENGIDRKKRPAPVQEVDADEDDDGEDEEEEEEDEAVPGKASSSGNGKAKSGSKRKARELEARQRKGPRLSKRARQKSGKSGSPAPGRSVADDFAGDFEISVDGVKLGAGSGKAEGSGAKASSKKSAEVPQFYLSVERDAREDAKERGLDMEQYQMDLMPDDSTDIKKQKSVVRWDAKKKKYLPVMVSVDGRVVKGSRKNESGQRVKGEGDKSTIYKKWAQNTKKRIQKVGEMEQAYVHPLTRKAQQLAAKEAGKTVEFDNMGEVQPSAEGKARERKPVVPFHGKIDEKYLTNKQKRMTKRREKNDSVVGGQFAKKELKTTSQIQKDKKQRDKNKIKHDPNKRKEASKKAKDQRTDMHKDRQMTYGARTKSKMLIFDRDAKWKKKKGKSKGMATI
mmetsp:Transcript_43271/g.139034  ORF Transcript_43271/g.139034 Transcript_43271/m.139034 type:complete len:961 (+) Transcript_43271:132-3014(+)